MNEFLKNQLGYLKLKVNQIAKFNLKPNSEDKIEAIILTILKVIKELQYQFGYPETGEQVLKNMDYGNGYPIETICPFDPLSALVNPTVKFNAFYIVFFDKNETIKITHSFKLDGKNAENYYIYKFENGKWKQKYSGKIPNHFFGLEILKNIK